MIFPLLQPVAGFGKSPAGDEEGRAGEDIEDVKHNGSCDSSNFRVGFGA